MSKFEKGTEVAPLDWERRDAGEWVGRMPWPEHQYLAIVGLDASIDGWVATLHIDGVLVYRNEHTSRDHARREVQNAVLRALTLRHGPVFLSVPSSPSSTSKVEP